MKFSKLFGQRHGASSRKNASRQRRKLAFEGLESRQLMATGMAVLAGGVLQITADPLTSAVEVLDVWQPTSSAPLRWTYVKATSPGHAPVVQPFAPGMVNKIVFHGSAGNDRFENKGTVPCVAYGNNGADVLIGGAADDQLVGGAGNDKIWGQGGNDTLWGQDGNDQLIGGAGNDKIVCGNHNDMAWGQGGNDTLWGENGADQLIGGAGNDDLIGGAHNDKLWGEAGNDRLWGDAGNDFLDGGLGADRLDGGDNNDKLFGRAGGDILLGGAGNDFLDDGSGTEYVDGGLGYDYNAYKWAIGGAKFDDIYQGNYGNCGVLAAISSVAHTGVDLAKRIQYLGDGNYRVSLYSAPGKLSYVDVKFDGTVDPGDAQPNPNQEGDFWVTILNRALSKPLPELAGSPYQWDGFGRLLDRPGQAYSAKPLGNQDLARIILARQQNKPVIVGHHGHYRAVLAVRYNSTSKQWEVDLRDPHGSDFHWTTGNPGDGLITISWATFTGTDFAKYVICW